MLNIGNVLDYFGVDDSFLSWPPDVFAVAMSLLQKSGAYTRAVSGSWPPIDPTGSASPEEKAREWAIKTRRIGASWREAAIAKSNAPDEVVGWWREVQEARDLEVTKIRNSEQVVTALLQLSAVADEASAGVGLPPTRDEYELVSWITLDNTGSLSSRVDPSIARVLPKCHTPQVGMTIRSLSHHLSLCPSGDVEPKWYMFEPQKSERALNLLLIPWPRTLLPADFQKTNGPISNMSNEEFGFFTYGSRRLLETDSVKNYLNGPKRWFLRWMATFFLNSHLLNLSTKALEQ